jgi:hypothetical protein
MATPTINDPAPWSHPYIAARFNADDLPETFQLGDGRDYASFTNQAQSTEWALGKGWPWTT